jgi:hypothetical protein
LLCSESAIPNLARESPALFSRTMSQTHRRKQDILSLGL